MGIDLHNFVLKISQWTLRVEKKIFKCFFDFERLLLLYAKLMMCVRQTVVRYRSPHDEVIIINYYHQRARSCGLIGEVARK